MSRKGIQPYGDNDELWKAKHNMHRMLMNKKLLGGVVPPTSTATPTSKTKKKLFVGAVLPTSTATPTERERKLSYWVEQHLQNQMLLHQK